MSIKNPYPTSKEVLTDAGVVMAGKHHAFNEGVKAAVQYLKELCPNVSHKSVHFECKRVNCPDCMKQIHEELGQ